jgi:hypothetical protein
MRICQSSVVGTSSLTILQGDMEDFPKGLFCVIGDIGLGPRLLDFSSLYNLLRVISDRFRF